MLFLKHFHLHKFAQANQHSAGEEKPAETTGLDLLGKLLAPLLQNHYMPPQQNAGAEPCKLKMLKDCNTHAAAPAPLPLPAPALPVPAGEEKSDKHTQQQPKPAGAAGQTETTAGEGANNQSLQAFEEAAFQKLGGKVFKRPSAGPKMAAKKAKASKPPHPPSAGTRTLKLGCLRCRGAKNGCCQCRDPKFAGLRLSREEWNIHAKKHGLK